MTTTTTITTTSAITIHEVVISVEYTVVFNRSCECPSTVDNVGVKSKVEEVTIAGSVVMVVLLGEKAVQTESS